MRSLNVLLALCILSGSVFATNTENNNAIQRRQDSSASAFPTLGSESSQSASASVTSASSASNTRSSNAATESNSASPSNDDSISSSVVPSASANSTSTSPPSSPSSIIPPTSTPSALANGTTDGESSNENALPLPPHITPALSIGGVVLILTGVMYALIGVKNRWIHIFMSTAYLTSLSITVLIVYVMNPPVSNAIQGAYFVGIFMTGVIFGGGALIFKEVTEGLGCLLGGFCLSMWFMTLKPGGLITATSGKAIFISVFCALSWSSSFSHYTRPYGLIGSIAFSGATAFVLGIDCFSRGGLKEFWLYVWNLNEDLFPLNTTTYPITKGTRVESVVIILAFIIGVISQIRLWKVVKDRKLQKDAAHDEDTRRRDVVEAALGRHLERQNDRDRAEWEKQYGDRLHAKRDTILWTDAHGEKGYSRIKETEVKDNQPSQSVESLEMASLAPRHPRSVYVARVKRQSSTLVDTIPETEEGETSDKNKVRSEVLGKLEGNNSNPRIGAGLPPAASPSPALTPESDGKRISVKTLENDISRNPSPALTARRSATLEPADGDRARRLSSDSRKFLSPEDEKSKKRRSFTSLFSKSGKDETENPGMSPSQEALVMPDSIPHHSRASSLAATLDFENETMDLPAINTMLAKARAPPEIVVSSEEARNGSKRQSKARSDIREVPPSPPALSENFDLDPEEFVRPAPEEMNAVEDHPRYSSVHSSTTKRQSGSEDYTEGLSDEGRKSLASTSQTSNGEILSKGVLEQMPGQLSHVAMSYRTNEWAKHISTAEEPIFEEPEMIQGQDAEVPTHLADPTSPGEKSQRSSLNQIPPPPEVSVPIPSAIPSSTDGIRVNPVFQPEQVPTSATVQVLPKRPISGAETDTSDVPRGFRSTSTPLLKQASQPEPIDENTTVNFVAPQTNMRATTSHSMNPPMEYGQPTMTRSPSGATVYGNLRRENSRHSMVSLNGVGPMRSASQHSPYQQKAQRSETRLQSYDSHQPLRRNTSVENQRREAMLADWRMGQQKSPTQHAYAEAHRQNMLTEWHQTKAMEEYGKNYRMQQELAMDARMRGRDMQELHREAMRKMQAGANRKMTN